MTEAAPRWSLANRRTVSLMTLVGVFVLILATVPDVLLIVFAGVLIGVFLHGGGMWIAEHTGTRRGIGLAIFCLIIIASLTIGGLVSAPFLLAQFNELSERLPEAVEALGAWLEQMAWARELLQSVDLAEMMQSGSLPGMTALAGVVAAIVYFVLILFIGIYLAVNPDIYKRGAKALVAPSLRPKAESVLQLAGRTLHLWLSAQLVAMAFIGVMTTIGLWALGVALAPILGFLAAILTFIPNIGPILSAVPAVLLAFVESPALALWVIGLYVVVQSAESYFVTPLLQQRNVALPPVLILAVQVMFGFLFGVLGLALATPFAAVALAVGRRLYVQEYLDEEPDPAAAGREAEPQRPA